ncbi:ABC transporter ATP-binding protein [Thiohalorhabdus denitrificans]|uniref:Zinc transport system ATP-binding protein n=1 Tax=Thiohalorhabdus denitrificans TaxID=381306 RepID=A0A0P9ES93_9GAMM|nr:metal ABC transporter ATP-binding protein [Thiohalorhabdus denitrificans]KPV41471.1 ABC transporter ATP-binding protein [Thiohalorhabdus denitrificans]SCY28696.1 zinc transport system ATP-binding protein [Thiohalorhabdus denitrificans]
MTADSTDPLLEVEDLSVRYGEVIALDRVSFRVSPGEFLAVLGPNGSGKTTLFRCILGLESYAGTIRNRARRVGYVPQIKNFDRSFPGRPREVVISGITGSWPARPARRLREQARRALERVGAGDYEDRPLAALSGGQLQRVYLARALVADPDLLLLDEPAAGVDRTGEYDLYQYLETYQAEHPGVAIAMITHDWEVARHHAHTSLILNHRVIGVGPSAEVLTEDCLRRAFGHMGHAHVLGPDHA